MSLILPIQGKPNLRRATAAFFAATAIGHTGDTDDGVGIDLKGRPLHFAHLLIGDVFAPQESIRTRFRRQDVPVELEVFAAPRICGVLRQSVDAQ